MLDALFLLTAFWLAFFMRLDSFEPLFNQEYWFLFLGLLPASLLAFIKQGLYRAVLRYINLHALWAVGVGTAIATFMFIGLAFFFEVNVPRTVPFIFACFCLLFIGGSRIIARSLIGRHYYHKKEAVVIYGAGSAGRQLANALAKGQEYYVAGFIDDDKTKHKTIIQGITVSGLESIEAIINKKNITRILLALPSVKRVHRKEILLNLESLPLLVQSIPGLADMVEGNAQIAEFKDVEIEDLLGRDPVAPKADLMAVNITNKVVMITGAGGSIGSELCRQIIKQNPKKLVLFELSEFALYSIDKELNEYKAQHSIEVEILPLVGSVQHINRLEAVMISFNVQTVYHAAAYKHVPLVEHNVVEGVRNNIFGTYYAAKAAIKAKVNTFVLISTDKAVRPTNVMGATKRMAELCLQALAKTQNKTNFCMVRFGNVLGSSGSVVPLFRKQIAMGGPITLTHQDITRYFMTIPEAAQLVIQAGGMGKGGDVFVLDMGDSVKIKDLATKMINLSGYEVLSKENPNGDIEIKCTGLRPGEKLYEELLIGDNVSGTSHERIMTANELMLEWVEIEALLNKLDIACHNFEHKKIRQILLDAPLGFVPSDGICDLVWLEKKEAKIIEPLLKTVS
ncbi:nucleoside-diphosphate sugar epimerase [Pseudoalteromonas sp. NBT06-2]|uniref:polysaccharide biosynthesis protein n=1 Tax=Pseudoalteromonas sp. NBT06-2 TaxID=2025950 RepID=UPI000BA55A7C|nr:nucleoside-diphosphate sugar epimerase/dehydratase [Pseudoalteromonas sp. NBT06-2]PAJ74860.1 nucleoside-diphosphate sugar epimerase [Pseudoalteromonas sp. NBT06-2]